jgi:hypothetical protein
MVAEWGYEEKKSSCNYGILKKTSQSMKFILQCEAPKTSLL